MGRLINAVVILALGTANTAGAANYGKHDVNARYVWWTRPYLTEGTSYTFLSTNLQGGADTEIHVMNLSTNQLVAWNDDWYEGRGSCKPELEPMPQQSCVVFTAPTTGFYAVVVVTYKYAPNTGTADIHWLTGTVQTAFYNNIQVGGTWTQVGITAQDTIQTALLNQGTTDTVLYGFGASGGLAAINDDGGVGYASKISSTGVDWVATGTYSPGEGMARVLVNDLAGDHDGDGLGEQLERALCSCDYFGHYTCPWNSFCWAYNYKDSDGDGISDDHETFGKEGWPPQHLPAWGAGPGHPDVFVEVDRVDDGTLTVQPLTALGIADSYENAPGSGQYLQNWDLTEGIKVHLDTGVSSTGTTYGAWGGGGTPVPVGISAGAAYNDPQYFADVRKGIFHYALARAAQSGGNSAGVPAVTFGGAYNSRSVLAHELGHNLGLFHGGRKSAVDQNAKPHYRSIMNYSFGPAEVSPDFSLDEFASAGLNPTSLCEANGLMTSDRAKIAYLESGYYNYTVEAQCGSDGNSNCGVDWNRDGVISPCSTVVRAAPNQTRHVHASPELGRYYWYWGTKHPSFAAPTPDDTASPALARAFNRMHVAYRDAGGAIKMLHTGHDFITGCTNLDSGCATWSTITVAATSDAGGPAIAPTWYNSLMVVYKSGGMLRYVVYDNYYNVAGSGTVPGSTGVLFEPVLGRYGNAIVLLYRKGQVGQNAQVYANTFNTGTWSGSSAQTIDGQPLVVYSTAAMAGYPSGTRAVFSYYSPGAPPQHYLRWAEYQGDGTWSRIYGSDIESTTFASAQTAPRVGLAYRPFGGSLSGGRWYLLFNNMAKDSIVDLGWVMLNMTGGDGSHGQLVWSNETRYDNEWFVSRGGVALLGWQAGTAEQNLRMAVVMDGGVLQFRPFADGILDLQLKDSNDWEVMGRSLCSSLWGCDHQFCGGPGSCPGGEGGEQQCP